VGVDKFMKICPEKYLQFTIGKHEVEQENTNRDLDILDIDDAPIPSTPFSSAQMLESHQLVPILPVDSYHLGINDERTCLGLHSCSNNICNIWEMRGGVITITGKDSN
jgi:hypothetical protein